MSKTRILTRNRLAALAAGAVYAIVLIVLQAVWQVKWGQVTAFDLVRVAIGAILAPIIAFTFLPGLTRLLFFKELKALFTSWIAYTVLITFILISGLVFYFQLNLFEQMVRFASSVEEGMSRQGWNLVEELIYPLYKMVFLLLFIIVPAITMRLFAEEKRLRTYELLLTSPVRVIEIVVAKYLAAAVLITAMMLPVMIFPAIAIKYSQPVADWGPMVSGYVALLLMGYGLAAIGVFASSLTENQIVAFILALALEMMLFLVSQAGIAVDLVPIGPLVVDLGGLLRSLSISDHFETMMTGFVRLHDFYYFGALIVFWLWATAKSVESARWS